MTTSIEAITDKLASFEAQRNPERHSRRRSAVALITRDSEVQGVEVLMIQRAECERDPWSGHMAFPGGRVDPGDAHSFDAAKRETLEEIALDIDQHGQYLGRLSDLSTHIRSGTGAMLVTPFVFALDTVPELRPNYEVADILWIPLAFLADAGNRQSMDWQYDGHDLQLPCYYYDQRRIWGLSLGMLDEFLRVLGLAGFDSRRPE